jgi:hypothetical protein
MNFITNEVTLCIHEYSLSDFKKINIKNSVEKWIDDLNSNGSSYPLFKNSIFNKKPNRIPTKNIVKPLSDILYVVPHYFYLYSNYLISEKLNSTSLIYLNELGGTFFPDKPMDYVLHEGEKVYFECESATEGTEFSCYVYWGNKLICNSLITSFSKDSLKNICAFIENINE